MPITLSVGLCRKIGLPEYSSIGATCNLSVELDSGLLADVPALHERISAVQLLVSDAVDAELARLQAPQATPAPSRAPAPAPASVPARVPALATVGAGTGADGRPPDRRREWGPPPVRTPQQARQGSARTASDAQLKLIRQLAQRAHVSLTEIAESFGAASIDQLESKQASQAIDRLKADD